MLYILKHGFCFFADRNITKFCKSIHFKIHSRFVTLLYQVNLEQLFVLFVLRNNLDLPIKR